LGGRRIIKKKNGLHGLEPLLHPRAVHARRGGPGEARPGAHPPLTAPNPAPLCGRFGRDKSLRSGAGGRMAATLWFYVRDDKRQGPVDFEHLVTMLLAGQIPHNALVWHQGLREWSQADAIPEI